MDKTGYFIFWLNIVFAILNLLLFIFLPTPAIGNFIIGMINTACAIFMYSYFRKE